MQRVARTMEDLHNGDAPTLSPTSSSNMSSCFRSGEIVFERFSDAARRKVVLALEQARHLRHDSSGPNTCCGTALC
jgi:hypothetical protein